DVQYFVNSFHVRFAPPCFGYVHVTSYRWRARNRRFLCGWRLQGRCPMLVFLISRIFLISVRKSLITSAMPCSIMCCTLLPPVICPAKASGGAHPAVLRIESDPIRA